MKKGLILLLCLSLFGCRKSIVSTEGSVDQTLCEKVNEQYNSLPDPLKKECKSIVLCDLDSFEINGVEYYDLGIHNANEFFCEALSLYITSPKELKDWNEDVYKYLKTDICF